ncbi:MULTISPECIES: helix-turn-helix domain-containing protein [Clostridium]|uniref:helix-turn-helix domain-containing protein n=1 Tax=Clostridium TaxID=1485 RepID=UPI000824010A|nr:MULTISPECIES: helix-turn-helix transcriptional regulator [Clostridium]PJI08441.1 XRE family transcriptional regulator [Clostridium sp. CT7]
MGEKRCLTSLGIACKKRMVEKSISQTELAQKVGTSSKYLDLIFHGERAGKKYISRIVKELGINPDNINKNIA